MRGHGEPLVLFAGDGDRVADQIALLSFLVAFSTVPLDLVDGLDPLEVDEQPFGGNSVHPANPGRSCVLVLVDGKARVVAFREVGGNRVGRLEVGADRASEDARMRIRFLEQYRHGVPAGGLDTYLKLVLLITDVQVRILDLNVAGVPGGEFVPGSELLASLFLPIEHLGINLDLILVLDFRSRELQFGICGDTDGHLLCDLLDHDVELEVRMVVVGDDIPADHLELLIARHGFAELGGDARHEEAGTCETPAQVDVLLVTGFGFDHDGNIRAALDHLEVPVAQPNSQLGARLNDTLGFATVSADQTQGIQGLAVLFGALVDHTQPVHDHVGGCILRRHGEHFLELVFGLLQISFRVIQNAEHQVSPGGNRLVAERGKVFEDLLRLAEDLLSHQRLAYLEAGVHGLHRVRPHGDDRRELIPGNLVTLVPEVGIAQQELDLRLIGVLQVGGLCVHDHETPADVNRFPDLLVGQQLVHNDLDVGRGNQVLILREDLLVLRVLGPSQFGLSGIGKDVTPENAGLRQGLVYRGDDRSGFGQRVRHVLLHVLPFGLVEANVLVQDSLEGDQRLPVAFGLHALQSNLDDAVPPLGIVPGHPIDDPLHLDRGIEEAALLLEERHDRHLGVESRRATGELRGQFLVVLNEFVRVGRAVVAAERRPYLPDLRVITGAETLDDLVQERDALFLLLGICVRVEQIGQLGTGAIVLRSLRREVGPDLLVKRHRLIKLLLGLVLLGYGPVHLRGHGARAICLDPAIQHRDALVAGQVDGLSDRGRGAFTEGVLLLDLLEVLEGLRVVARALVRGADFEDHVRRLGVAGILLGPQLRELDCAGNVVVRDQAVEHVFRFVPVVRIRGLIGLEVIVYGLAVILWPLLEEVAQRPQPVMGWRLRIEGLGEVPGLRDVPGSIGRVPDDVALVSLYVPEAGPAVNHVHPGFHGLLVPAIGLVGPGNGDRRAPRIGELSRGFLVGLNGLVPLAVSLVELCDEHLVLQARTIRRVCGQGFQVVLLGMDAVLKHLGQFARFLGLHFLLEVLVVHVDGVVVRAHHMIAQPEKQEVISRHRAWCQCGDRLEEPGAVRPALNQHGNRDLALLLLALELVLEGTGPGLLAKQQAVHIHVAFSTHGTELQHVLALPAQEA